MSKRISVGSRVADWVIYILLALLALICLYPLYQVLVCSVSDPAVVIARNSLLMWPVGFHLDAYRMVLQNRNILSGFQNTLIYLTLGTAFQYALTVLTAYPISLKDAKLKKPLMLYLTVTMYFSGGLIPYYLLINRLGMMNTVWVLTVPGAVSVWNIIIMRTQFMSVPDSLKEAAIIDGAGDTRVLFSILVPLSGAVSAVILLFSAVGYWNMWFEPMIFMTERGRYPIQSVLREILIDNSTQMMAGSANANVKINRTDTKAVEILIKYANIIVCTVPVLCVYPFAQKYFVKGVMIGSLKG